MQRCAGGGKCSRHLLRCDTTSQPNTPLLLHSGCCAVRYCNATCQRGDWRQGRHREVCAALNQERQAAKAAAAAAAAAATTAATAEHHDD